MWYLRDSLSARRFLDEYNIKWELARSGENAGKLRLLDVPQKLCESVEASVFRRTIQDFEIVFKIVLNKKNNQVSRKNFFEHVCMFMDRNRELVFSFSSPWSEECISFMPSWMHISDNCWCFDELSITAKQKDIPKIYDYSLAEKAASQPEIQVRTTSIGVLADQIEFMRNKYFKNKKKYKNENKIFMNDEDFSEWKNKILCEYIDERGFGLLSNVNKKWIGRIGLCICPNFYYEGAIRVFVFNGEDHQILKNPELCLFDNCHIECEIEDSHVPWQQRRRITEAMYNGVCLSGKTSPAVCLEPYSRTNGFIEEKFFLTLRYIYEFELWPNDIIWTLGAFWLAERYLYRKYRESLFGDTFEYRTYFGFPVPSNATKILWNPGCYDKVQRLCYENCRLFSDGVLVYSFKDTDKRKKRKNSKQRSRVKTIPVPEKHVVEAIKWVDRVFGMPSLLVDIDDANIGKLYPEGSDKKDKKIDPILFLKNPSSENFKKYLETRKQILEEYKYDKSYTTNITKDPFKSIKYVGDYL